MRLALEPKLKRGAPEESASESCLQPEQQLCDGGCRAEGRKVSGIFLERGGRCLLQWNDPQGLHGQSLGKTVHLLGWILLLHSLSCMLKVPWFLATYNKMQKKSDLLTGLGNWGKPELDNLEDFPLLTMAPDIAITAFIQWSVLEWSMVMCPEDGASGFSIKSCAILSEIVKPKAIFSVKKRERKADLPLEKIWGQVCWHKSFIPTLRRQTILPTQ